MLDFVYVCIYFLNSERLYGLNFMTNDFLSSPIIYLCRLGEDNGRRDRVGGNECSDSIVNDHD